MFVSDRFVYLELHKTGCTHIRNILNDLLDGEFMGKHNQATPDLFDGNRIFLGSVRDPWEWYASLWSYGCDRRGGVFSSVTRRRMSVRGLGWKSNPYASFLRLLAVRSRSPQAWIDTYSDINDPDGFRAWLRMMHDEKTLADIGEGYGDSPVSRAAGLMTYRYLKLFCARAGERKRLDRLSTMEEIRQYEQDNCFIDHFIRNETLEGDLFDGLDLYGVEISDETRSEVLSRPRTNVSSRKQGPEYYYDSASAALVAERERLIIEKFGYSAPGRDS